MTEAELLEEVRKLCKLYGILFYHTYDSRRSKEGFFDLVLVKAPDVVFAELKGPKGRVSPEQVVWMEEVKKCPGVQAYLWKPQDLLEINEVCKAMGLHHPARGALKAAPLLKAGAIARAIPGQNRERALLLRGPSPFSLLLVRRHPVARACMLHFREQRRQSSRPEPCALAVAVPEHPRVYPVLWRPEETAYASEGHRVLHSHGRRIGSVALHKEVDGVAYLFPGGPPASCSCQSSVAGRMGNHQASQRHRRSGLTSP